MENEFIIKGGIKMLSIFQKIKDSVKESIEKEKALEAADPIAYRQMKAMEELAENQERANAQAEREARLEKLHQQEKNAALRAALTSSDASLTRNALLNTLN